MKLAAVISLALLALPAAAHAGGYASVGLGTAPSFGGDLEQAYSGEDHQSARVMIGRRFSFIGLEAGVGGYGLHGVSAATGDLVDARAYSLTAAVTVHKSLAPKLEGFLRLGRELTWVSGDGADRPITGGGYVLGAGVAIDLAAGVSLWVEADRELVQLERDDALLSGSVDTLSVGVRFGL